MGSLINKLKTIRSRLMVQKFIDACLRFLLIGFSFNLAIVLIDRLFFIGLFVVYLPALIVGIAFICALLYAVIKSPGLFEAALEADERAGLKERISSAYLLRIKESPAAVALREDAEAHSRLIEPSTIVGFRLPRIAYSTFAVLVVFVLCNSFLPYLDVVRRKARLEQRLVERRSVQEMSRRIQNISELLKREAAKAGEEKRDRALDALAKDLEQISHDLDLNKIDRKEAAVKLSKLTDKIAERQNIMRGEFKNLDELSRSIDQKLTKNLTEALAKGDLENAQEELKKIGEAIREGTIPSGDMNRLSSELGRLSEALKQISPELAKKLAAAAKELKEGELLKAAGELALSEEDLMALTEALDQMDMLGNLTADMEARKQALLADVSVLGKGEGDESRDFIGPGMRGGGIGKGGEASFDESQTVTFEDTKITGEKGKGRIISEIMYKGQPLEGDVTEDYKQVYIESKQEAEDSLSREVIPAGYRKFVIDYFDSINPDKLKGP